MYILMEYAEGGSLADMIRRQQNSGQKFTDDQIFMYTA